jgi:hypothetical protein
MAGAKQSLTGIWHGLYTYAGQPEPVYFVATLIHSGALLMGTTHESAEGRSGAPLTLFASIDGRVDADIVTFSKTYDGSDGWNHAVSYEGLLNGERSEIEGHWAIAPGNGQMGARGRFLMIRSSGASEAMLRKAFAKA